MSVQTELLVDRPDMIPTVAGWWFDEWGHVTPEITRDQNEAQVRASVSHDRLPVHFVAFVDGEPAGAAMLKEHEMAYRYPDWKYWLGNVFVDEAWRGRGVARALSVKILEIGRSRGIPALHLQTKQLDGGLYARLGWRPVETVEHRGKDVVVMIQELSETAG